MLEVMKQARLIEGINGVFEEGGNVCRGRKAEEKRNQVEVVEWRGREGRKAGEIQFICFLGG
jgi:hypothetical protein